MSAYTKKGTRNNTLRQPVEQVWLAGLGALALTEEEGSKVFKSLVKRGQGFEKNTRARLNKVMAATKAAPGQAYSRIELGVSDTFSGVLRRLGVPSRREINSLTKRVEGLATTLEKQAPRMRRSTTTKRHKAVASGTSAS